MAFVQKKKKVCARERKRKIREKEDQMLIFTILPSVLFFSLFVFFSILSFCENCSFAPVLSFYEKLQILSLFCPLVTALLFCPWVVKLPFLAHYVNLPLYPWCQIYNFATFFYWLNYETIIVFYNLQKFNYKWFVSHQSGQTLRYLEFWIL